MKIKMDDDLQSVLEFMQQNIRASKLVGVADKLPHMARALWSEYTQEPFRSMELESELSPSIPSSERTQPSAMQ